MSSGRKQITDQRIVERAAVNRVRELFESRGQVFLEVSQSNDYGKDAYVDISDEREVTGQVIALQIKGGNSYSSSKGWFVPYSPADYAFWTESTLPVFGIVHDPTADVLYWINLTEELRTLPDNQSGRIYASLVLNGESWQSFLLAARRASTPLGSVLGLYSDAPDKQGAAVWDCFAVGQVDYRALVMLRYALGQLHPEVLPDAAYALAHCVQFHPDIWPSPTRTVAGKTKAAVVSRFRWTVTDAILLLKLVDRENMFRRGSVGEDVYLLLSSGWGPDVVRLFDEVLQEAIRTHDEFLAVKAVAVLQYQFGDDASEAVTQLADEYPQLQAMPEVRQLMSAVTTQGWLDIA
ncbi:hypothetical protein HDA40_003744 [Hamadaea flava]|uniref:DUF4365 domain-containing protein n=1 Tax=Hamadaea flava TaxID=1742688 RepID=A0ABV8LJA3_9ACTN|nr:DUF4365 domain-containing protein [Hamadaea flava]MCP2325237.1 hypothetical protein [Hamadaea flava]